MRLTLACMSQLKKRIPGNLYRGKNRIVAPIKMRDMERTRKEFERQDQIMYLLRYPYLTQEQTRGCDQALQLHAKRIAKLKETQQQRPLRKDITIVERLYHLTVGDKWE